MDVPLEVSMPGSSRYVKCLPFGRFKTNSWFVGGAWLDSKQFLNKQVLKLSEALEVQPTKQSGWSLG